MVEYRISKQGVHKGAAMSEYPPYRISIQGVHTNNERKCKMEKVFEQAGYDIAPESEDGAQ